MKLITNICFVKWREQLLNYPLLLSKYRFEDKAVTDKQGCEEKYIVHVHVYIVVFYLQVHVKIFTRVGD